MSEIEEGSIAWFGVRCECNRVVRVHVLPCDDLRIHDVGINGSCWCGPEHLEDEGTIVHQSLDGREPYQNGERRWH